MKTLGGTLFVHNAISQDYCLEEAVRSLQALCDKVVILDAGSTDGTAELVRSFWNDNTTIALLDEKLWNAQQGRQKLSHFTNKAIAILDTDYNFNLQADEVVHEGSFDAIRKAVEKGHESYLCHRINLWGSTKHQLDVPHERKPVGTHIVRLAKTNYMSYDDAQDIACHEVCTEFFDQIRIYHMGFVRDKYKHCDKVKNMQENIFQFAEMDIKVQEMNGVFDAWKHFSKDDIIPIKEPLPIFVQDWARERDKINQFM
jgi:glycosyltransferase involved in cell wall biosynthesis